jgi:5'-nucleotidase
MTRPLIVLVNDDGIESPGIAAAAEALDPLGDLLIVAPYRQQSGMGRSMPKGDDYDGRLAERAVMRGEKIWNGYAAYASPAQAIQHAIHELADRKPSLAVSGVNFGENVGTGVTISGTVGAAMESAAHGIPSLAISLQVDPKLHVHYDNSVDFSAAIYFTRFFAERWLAAIPVPEVDLLKIEIPENATPQTEWRMVRLERLDYYVPVPPDRKGMDVESPFGYRKAYQRTPTSPNDTDAATMNDGYVAVTPITLDMTSPVSFEYLTRMIKGER